MNQIVQDINTLGHYLGKRDVNFLDITILKQKYGIEQADVFADVIKNKLIKKYIIRVADYLFTDIKEFILYEKYLRSYLDKGS